MHSFIQQSLIQKLTEWQTENTRLTKELCYDLLSKLKRQHLDPILRQLQGHGGSKLSFDDIIGVYHRIKDDYEGEAVGAKDAIAAAFFDFQPVSIFLPVKRTSCCIWPCCGLFWCKVSFVAFPRVSFFFLSHIVFVIVLLVFFLFRFSSSLCPRSCAFVSSLAGFPENSDPKNLPFLVKWH